MTGALVVAWLAFRSGMTLRKARQQGAPAGAPARGRHLRLARPAVLLLLLGAIGGPLSAWWLRDWTPFRTFHAWAGLACLVAFLVLGAAGRRLERGELAGRPLHARGALLAVLLVGSAQAAYRMGAVLAHDGLVLATLVSVGALYIVPVLGFWMGQLIADAPELQPTRDG